MSKSNYVLVRGGGDLASGVALRLHRADIQVLITELAQPLAVRRTVSFAEAAYSGTHTIEGVTARLIKWDQLSAGFETDEIPVLIDPDAEVLIHHPALVVVDGRLTKQTPAPLPVDVPLHIGLGPGFRAGRDCHAVIETRRSHTLGRVYWNGSTQPDSRLPEGDPRRVLRAPMDGVMVALKKIGDHIDEGDTISEIRSENGNQNLRIKSPFAGVLRGLIRDGLHVTKGLKIGDVDARNDVSACYLVSDKALAVGGGVLEAILSRAEIRRHLFS